MSPPPEDDHEHHQHAAVAFDVALVEDAALKELDAAFAPLAEHLSLVAKYTDLSQTERGDAVDQWARVEKESPFMPGFHAEGDSCAVCEEPVDALWTDRFKTGQTLAWSAFVADLPVHPRCVGGFTAKYPRVAPRVIDQARRKLSTDHSRPPPGIATFWRHDVVKHGTFDLEDWANAVIDENEETMDRRMVKGIQKLVDYVHGALYHAH